MTAARTRQQGMAVIAALLVVAAAAVIASSLLHGQSERAQLVQSERARVQAHWLLLGGIEWARQILRDDARRNPVTRADQPWALPIVDLRLDPPGESQPALLSGRIEDEQGKFNLQNLAQEGQVNPRALVVFERLLQALNLRPSVAPDIARRIAAAQPRPTADAAETGNTGSAASPTTSGIPGPNTRANLNTGDTRATRPPIAPGVQALADLRGIAGLDDAALQRLDCYATILPDPSPVNVNTAPPEVLYAVVPQWSLGQAVALAAERDRGRYFNDPADFANRLANPQIKLDKDSVSTVSVWFSLAGIVRLGRATVAMRALLERDGDRFPSVVWMRDMN